MAPKKKPMPRTLNLRKRNGPTLPQLVEDGKLLSPAVKFTAVTLLRWFEYLAEKHEKPKMGAKAWECILAIVDQEYNTGQELFDIRESWWKDHNVLQ